MQNKQTRPGRQNNPGQNYIKKYLSIIPQPVEESCLQCHAAQGYKVGDIRGGISVSIPASDIIAQIRTSKIFIVVFALTVLKTLTVIILLISNQLIKKLHNAEKTII